MTRQINAGGVRSRSTFPQISIRSAYLRRSARQCTGLWMNARIIPTRSAARRGRLLRKRRGFRRTWFTAETAEDAWGYAQRYWVSVDTGLLVVAERLQKGETVYRMAALEADQTAPPAETFTLPDGTDLLHR